MKVDPTAPAPTAPLPPPPLRPMLRDLRDGPRAPHRSPSEVDGVGHRIVHGGERFRNPTRITGELKALVRTR